MTGMDGINSLQKMLGALQVNDSSSVNGTAAKTASGTASIAKSGNSVDYTSLSAAGGLAASQSTDTSDVRMDRVTELQQAIAGGTYNVPASAVADKMVESLLK